MIKKIKTDKLKNIYYYKRTKVKYWMINKSKNYYKTTNLCNNDI